MFQKNKWLQVHIEQCHSLPEHYAQLLKQSFSSTVSPHAIPMAHFHIQMGDLPCSEHLASCWNKNVMRQKQRKVKKGWQPPAWSRTQDTSGLSCQYSATEPWQPYIQKIVRVGRHPAAVAQWQSTGSFLYFHLITSKFIEICLVLLRVQLPQIEQQQIQCGRITT